MRLTGFNGSSFIIHLVDYYDASNIQITAVDNSGNKVKFINGQAQIDVTGKAKNVLKRLQVRVPLSSSAQLPAFPVEGQNICKRLQSAAGATNFIDTSDGYAGSGDPCNLTSN